MTTATLKRPTEAKAKVRAEAAKNDVTSDYDSIKADISALSDDIKSLFSNLGEVAKGETGKGVEKSKDLADKASDNVSEARTYVEGKVRENPLAAIGIAMGTGFFLAALRRN